MTQNKTPGTLDSSCNETYQIPLQKASSLPIHFKHIVCLTILWVEIWGQRKIAHTPFNQYADGFRYIFMLFSKILSHLFTGGGWYFDFVE